MNQKLIIEDIPLKTFLSLFNLESKIDIVELGDTSHPSSGFVDKIIIENLDTIYQIINFNYDFEGLVYFEGFIEELSIRYTQDKYEVEGDSRSIEKLISKMKMYNEASNYISSPRYIYKSIH